MQVTTDPIGRAPNSGRDIAAGLVLHPEEQRAELEVLAQGVRELGEVSRKDLLDGLAHSRADWASQADSPEKSRALKRMDSDAERLSTLQGDGLPQLTDALLVANRERQDRLGLWCKVGIGVALGGFFLTMVWPSAPLQVASLGLGLAGVGTAATAAVKRYQTPERDTLGRLAAYGAIAQRNAQAASDVKQLVDALGHKQGTGIRQTEQGIQVGGVVLKKRKPL
ncbi:MAG: hypothetical protein AB1758_07730 [Candidatus Eremiobacterota bacterium]